MTHLEGGKILKGRSIRTEMLQIDHNPPFPLFCITHQSGEQGGVRNEEKLCLGKTGDVGEGILICFSVPKATLAG